MYDAAWNLTTRTNYGTAQAFAVNVKNELTTAVGLTCTYDANGNLVSRVYDSNGPKIYYYAYDDENQLIEMRTDTYYTSAANRFKTEWVYDGFGRVRVRKEYYWYTGYEVWALSEEVRYLYDGRRVIQERNSGNTPTVSYTRGNDLSASLEGAGGIGGLLGRSHGYSGGTWSTHNHYHADGNGNVTYLVNSSQGEAASYRYDPYGRVMGSSGTLAAANLYRFSSKEIHAKSGMYYYGFRFYDPHLQRWLNRDPIFEAGGINLYGFVGNNPMMFVDPYGLYSFGEWLQIGGAFCQGAAEGLVDTFNPIPTIVENQDRLADAFVSGDGLIIAGALSVAVGDSILLGTGRGKGAKVRTAAKRGGESVAAAAGRQAHKLYNPGPSYNTRYRLPSGRRPDAVDIDARIVRELNPNNPRAIRRGQRQVERYCDELKQTLGGDWKGIVDRCQW